MQRTSRDLEYVPYNISLRRTFNWFFFESLFKVVDGFKLKLRDLLFLMKTAFKLIHCVPSFLKVFKRGYKINIGYVKLF